MTSRERWIVYPLLLLTLGIVTRDKLIPPRRLAAREVRAQQIHCDHLTAGQAECYRLETEQAQVGMIAVAGPNGSDRVRPGVEPPGGGRLQLNGRHGKQP